MRWVIGLGALLVAVTPAWGASNVLSWTDNSTNETGFVIERKAEACAGPTAFVQVGTTPANVTTWTDTIAIVEGVTYCYRVAAVNLVGLSAFSNTAQATIPLPPARPLAPSGLTVAPGP